MLPNPPITAAMNALSTGVKPMYGLIWPAWTAYRSPATAASPAPMANAVATTRLILMPISCAALRSSAAARIESPSVVRVTNTVSRPSRTIPATKLTTLTLGTMIDPIVDDPAQRLGAREGDQRSACPASRVVSSVPFWRIWPDRERGQQHRDVRGAADRPVGDPLHEQPDHDRPDDHDG